MSFLEALAPSLQTWYLACPADDGDGHSVAISFAEHPEGQQAEDSNAGEHDAHRGVERQVADGHQEEVEEDGGEPKPEVSQEVHHSIKDDGGTGVFLAYILREFHDAIGLSAQSSHGCGVVQGIARDGQPVDAPEADFLHSVSHVASDDASPSQGVQGIDDEPHSDDGNQPVAGSAEVVP